MILSNWRDSPKTLIQYLAPMLMFGGFAAAVAIAPELEDAPLLAVATIFIGAAFYAARNVAVGVIAVAIPLARHASLALNRQATKVDAQPADDDREPPGALMAICAIARFLVGGTLSNNLKTWKPMPIGALAFMQQNKLHGNLLPQFEWGSLIPCHMGDPFKAYIDPRL